MKPVLLLHGALGAKDQLKQLEEKLTDSFRVHLLNFSGHGGEPFPQEDFSIPLFAKEVLTYLDTHKIERISLFGYSMGGYAGMYLASQYPQRIEKLVTLATKFYWDEATAAREVKMLDATVIAQKVPAFAAQLKQRHAPNDWKEVLERTKHMLLQLGRSNTLSFPDYRSISTPALLLLGDSDKMVTLNETADVYRHLPNGQLGILPATHHPLDQVDPDLLCFFIKRFLQ